LQISREESEANKVAMEKEMSKVVAACEERLNALKAEHTQQIQQSKKNNLNHLFHRLIKIHNGFC
jgi:hypothetical protein